MFFNKQLFIEEALGLPIRIDFLASIIFIIEVGDLLFELLNGPNAARIVARLAGYGRIGRHLYVS